MDNIAKTRRKRKPYINTKICATPDCNSLVRCKGLCMKCYFSVRYARVKAQQERIAPPVVEVVTPKEDRGTCTNCVCYDCGNWVVARCCGYCEKRTECDNHEREAQP